MLNRVVLVGRLTKAPELRFTDSGKAVATFTLAVDRPFADANGERAADFINIVVWGKPAENSARYLGKGKLAAVDGRLQVRSWETNEGERRWVTEVVADRVSFLSPAGKGEKEPEEPEDADDYYSEDGPF